MDTLTDQVPDKYDLLVQGVMNLAQEVNYNFCLECCNFGKTSEFKTSKCCLCHEYICQGCGPILEYIIHKKQYDVCKSCHEQINNDNTLVLLLHTNQPDKLNTEIIESVLDQIEDHLESSEYYQYELNFAGLLPGNDNIYLIVSIDLKEDADSDYDIADVIDEINFYLSENPSVVIQTKENDDTSDHRSDHQNITIEIESFSA